MNVQLSKEIAKKVKELAISQGMTEDEIVEKIIEWFFEDCEIEK